MYIYIIHTRTHTHNFQCITIGLIPMVVKFPTGTTNVAVRAANRPSLDSVCVMTSLELPPVLRELLPVLRPEL